MSEITPRYFTSLRVVHPPPLATRLGNLFSAPVMVCKVPGLVPATWPKPTMFDWPDMIYTLTGSLVTPVSSGSGSGSG